MVFLSKTSIAKRGYVQREFRLALDTMQEMSEETIDIIPVRLDDCDVPNPFKHLHWRDLFEPDGFDRMIVDIRDSLERQAITPPDDDDDMSEPPSEPRVEALERFTNSIGMELVCIPAGTFWMGSPESDEMEPDNEKLHEVTISQPFYMGIYPVTQAQWEAVMGNHPRHFTGDSTHPVDRVSWEDAQEFLNRLSELDGRTYTLPTEAQWEYACRAGSTGRYCFGDDVSQLGDYAWYIENSDYTSHPVGQKQANAWGLYDMHGNVWEWCHDWLGHYDGTASVDPSSPHTSAMRVIRGGSWYDFAPDLRSACRRASRPNARYSHVGFRCSRG